MPESIQSAEPVAPAAFDANFECCADWKPGVAAIDGPAVLQQLRRPDYRPAFKAFVYCPWCGAPRDPERFEQLQCESELARVLDEHFKDSKPTPPEFQKIINDHFWDLF